MRDIFLTSGHVVRTLRDGADRAVLATMRPLLADLLADAGQRPGALIPRVRPIPSRPDFRVQCIAVHGRAAPFFRVYADPPSPVPADGAEAVALVSFGVAVEHGEAATATWRDLHRLPDALIAADMVPPPPPSALPWCAAVGHPGLLERPSAALWLVGFERAAAWELWAIARELP